MTNYEYLYNKEKYGSELTADHFSKAKLGWREIPGGTVLPFREIQEEFLGGITDADGGFIDGSSIYRGTGGSYDLAEENAVYCDEDAVFLGVWPEIWGHCLTDNIRRLWVLNDEEFMSMFGKIRFLYVPFQNREPGGNFRDLLDIIGVRHIRLEAVSEATRFRTIILPDECFWSEPDGTRMFTSEYAQMIGIIRRYAEENLVPAGDKKLYFTYKSYTDFRCIGEGRLEKFFSLLGYRVVAPEKYSFAEQLSMLLGCEEFASTVGSLSHNSIFLREGTKVFLIPRTGFISEYQLALDQVQKLDITYIDSSLSLYVKPKRWWEGPFYYIVSRQLRGCFGLKGRYKEGKLSFRVYRDLAYLLNGVSGPLDYYGCVMDEYLSTDPEWQGRETLMVKLLRKPRVLRWINRLMG